MSYFQQIDKNCIQLEEFTDSVNNCINEINLNKCPKNKISNFLNKENIDIYNNNINSLFFIFRQIPAYNDEITKNCNLKVLKCLNKVISFFLYFINAYNLEKSNESNKLCESVIKNILDNFSDKKGFEENFIFIIKNARFYFIEQNDNIKEIKKVCKFFDTINKLFQQNESFFKETNTENFLTFRKKFYKIKQLLDNKKSKIKEKNKIIIIKRDESRIEERLRQLNYQLNERNAKFLEDQNFKKSRSADTVYKEPVYSIFNNDIDNETKAKISLENLDFNNFTEPPALPMFEEELFQKELQCIEEFNKKLIKKYKSLNDIK